MTGEHSTHTILLLPAVKHLNCPHAKPRTKTMITSVEQFKVFFYRQQGDNSNDCTHHHEPSSCPSTLLFVPKIYKLKFLSKANETKWSKNDRSLGDLNSPKCFFMPFEPSRNKSLLRILPYSIWAQTRLRLFILKIRKHFHARRTWQ